MQQKPWAAGQNGSLCYFEPLSQTEVHPGRVPYCSVLLRMTCLNSRKWSEFHLKKVVSICHKYSQKRSTPQKWQIYPWMYWSNFFHFLVTSLSDVSLLVCAHLSLCRWHPQGASGFPPDEGPCCDSLGQLEGLPPARLPARGQGRASLLPWGAVTQLNVSDSHLFFT